MRSMRHLLFFLAPAIAAYAPSASAQTEAAAAAQLLFDEGKALAKRGDFAAACPKFVESHKLDPAGGTILHAADCHENEGKLATAWTEYNEALSFAVRDKRADREKIARDRIAAITPKLGRLALTFTPEVRAQADLALSIDGAPLPPAAWEAPVPLDRGTHRVEVSASGRLPRTLEVGILDGVTSELTIPELERAPVAQDAPPPPPAPDRTGETQRTIGIGVAGAGVLALGIGTAFGIRAMSIGDQSEHCTLGPNGDGCPQSAVDEQESARGSAAASTVAFVAAGVLLAGGAALYFTAPRAKTGVSAAMIPGGGVVVLRGSL